jgi:Spy/CpxP family protein refolding chaperone
MKTQTLALAVCLGLCMPLFAQHSGAGHTPYAGMQDRPIKSLSDNDINELRRGGGWGLALPAELNGMPGPSHVLELKDKLSLSAAQVTQIQKLFDDMKKAAIPVGERLIAAEEAIEKAFASGRVDEPSLRRLLVAAEAARTELRFIHLSQHYKTTPMLTRDQVKAYNVLRGYADDPCKNIPQGHDPEMYKKHMGCK